MERISTIGDVLDYLRDGAIITKTGKDQYVLKGERVVCYSNGTRYSLELKDFYEMYKKTIFFIYEDSVEIDQDKDEAYYRYYKK